MPPFVPPEPPEPPTLNVPLPPPEVGFGSPWAPADAENRDRILDWWRMWWRRVFFPWLAAFLAWLKAWLDSAAEYITKHAVNGHSWWKTDTPLNASGATLVTIEPYDEIRPLLVGDLVSDTTDMTRYGQIVALIDATHATVSTLGSLRGIEGHSWWSTVTHIDESDPTDVVLPVDADPNRTPQLGDLVSDQSADIRYGRITSITDTTHVTVTPLGMLRGPEGPQGVQGEQGEQGEQGAPGVADLGNWEHTTPSIAAGATEQFQMADMPQMVGAFTIDTDAPCWVRVYASQAYLLADASRGILTPLDIAEDHGCYLDFVSIPGELTKTLTPGVQITNLGSGLWMSIQNTAPSGSDAIRVAFDFRIFRE